MAEHPRQGPRPGARADITSTGTAWEEEDGIHVDGWAFDGQYRPVVGWDGEQLAGWALPELLKIAQTHTPGSFVAGRDAEKPDG
jgi:hypothetical protein